MVNQGQIFHVSLLFTKTRQLISEEISIDKLLANFSIILQIHNIPPTNHLTNSAIWMVNIFALVWLYLWPRDLCGGKPVPVIYITKSDQAESCVDIDNWRSNTIKESCISCHNHKYSLPSPSDLTYVLICWQGHHHYSSASMVDILYFTKSWIKINATVE